MQIGQLMRGPGDGVGLARPCRMLDQVFAARPLGQHRRAQLSRGVQLVKARKDVADRLLFRVPLPPQIAARISSQLSRAQISSHRYAVRWLFGFSGLPAAPWSPLLKGKNRVSGPSSRAAIITSLSLTAKSTKALPGKASSGSGFLPFSTGLRSKRYWSTAS